MPTLIENFNNLTEEDFSSYSQSQDVDVNGFELVGGNLHIFGNTWKVKYLTETIVLNPNSVWSIRAFIDSNPDESILSEIQGFGLAVVNPDGSLGDKIKYSFAGSQEVNGDTWEWVYQGAFSIQEWHNYELEVGKDFHRRFGYYPQIGALYFFNDDDPDGGEIDLVASISFDDIYDITDSIVVPPTITGRVEQLPLVSTEDPTLRSFQFNVNVTASSNVIYYWDFGDGQTSNQQNPRHSYNINERTPTFKAVCKVQDENGKWGWISFNIPSSQTNSQNINSINNQQFEMVFTGDTQFSRNFICEEYSEDGTECLVPGLLDTIGVDGLFEPTIGLLNRAEIKIMNLETVVSDADPSNAHPRKDQVLVSHPDTIQGLVNAGIDRVNLANNHSGDYLEVGIIDTIQHLEDNNIKYSGAGLNSYQAWLPENITYKGTNIAFVAICDRTGQYHNSQPFLNAGHNKSGFAMASVYDTNLVIDSLTNFSDLNVVELHAGYEYITSPDISNEAGANLEFRHQLADNPNIDLIVGHHPHVLQGVEWYNNTLIVHSLGNYIFDNEFPPFMGSVSVLFYPTVKYNKFVDYKFRPIFIDKYLTRPAVGELGTQTLNYLAALSRDMDTYLSVNKYGMDDNNPAQLVPSAKLIKDYQRNPKQNYRCTQELKNGYLIYDEETNNVMYQYDLIKIPDIANLSYIPPLQLSNNAKIRIGIEKMWFGNMEDEGANLWNINSEDEYYTSDDSFRGLRSLRQNRTQSNASYIVTGMSRRIPLIETPRVCCLQHTGEDATDLDEIINTISFSIHAAIKTVNSPLVKLRINFYPGRVDASIGNQELDTSPSGTMDWKVYDQELDIPDGTQYFNISMMSYPPTNGSSSVYWDDVGLITWEEWDSFDNNSNGIRVKNPYDYQYLQVRTQENLTGQEISFVETFYGKRRDNVSDVLTNQCTRILPPPQIEDIPT